MQVVLALPDRRETRHFFPVVVAAGFRWRVLRRVPRSDCVHPVHIYQLVPAPAPAPATASAIMPAAPNVPAADSTATSPGGCVASAMEALAADLPDSPAAAARPVPQLLPPGQVHIILRLTAHVPIQASFCAS